MIDFSIIIVSYNVKELIVKCIESVNHFFPEHFSFEIIVVDNFSTDDSVGEIKRLFPLVKLIVNKTNNGFSEANNQGMRIAEGRFIFLLNPDTELVDDSLVSILTYVKNNNNVIVAPRLINTDGTFQNSCFKRFKLTQIILETFYLHLLINNRTYNESELNYQRPVDAFSGAALVFSKELIEKIGMLDKNLFWMEDIDFCYRNQLNGGINFYLPETVIKHHSGKSASNNLNVAISNQIISKIKFIRKHKSVIEFILAILLSYLHIISRILVLFFFSVISNSNFVKCNAYVFTLNKMNIYLFNPALSVA